MEIFGTVSRIWFGTCQNNHVVMKFFVLLEGVITCFKMSLCAHGPGKWNRHW